MPGSTVKSLHTLSVENPGFATHPKFWTSYHLSIVNCSFQQIETDDTSDPASIPRPDDARLTLSAEKLAKRPWPSMKYFWVKEILLRNGSPITYINVPLSFSFGKRQVSLKDSKVHIFRFREQKFSQQFDTIIGYYMYNADQERRSMLRAPRAPHGLNNDPVKRLYNIRYRNVIPEDWRKDPYLVNLLLSLAQLQHRKCQAPQAGFFMTRLLVTTMSDRTHAYVFKANVPHQLLECLDDPTRSIEDFAFPTIACTKVLFEPYSTFAERIQFHLTGALYASRSDPVRSDRVAPPEPRGEKRKCNEPEEPSQKAAKRA
ncbi:hypothetical protein IL306_000437 [Fusarium sp. DS 682]|nr:hypothetical protein IL306_000437 [Fusarium sp. DS 682]